MEPTRFATARQLRTISRHQGFDYRGRLLLKTTDPNLYKNRRLRGFALVLERMLSLWFQLGEELAKLRNPSFDPTAALEAPQVRRTSEL